MQVETLFTGFANRDEAGHRLSRELEHYRQKANTVVLGLPRGGVITAAAIAGDLELPLDVVVIRKLGTPGQEELAMGAIGPEGIRVLNDDVVKLARIVPDQIEAATQRERLELDRRQKLYRGPHPPLDVRNKTVILVDDGLATGATMSAAVEVVRRQGAARIVLAIPVAPEETCRDFEASVDELVYLETPDPFGAVGYWYTDFAQVTDREVVAALDRARRLQPV
jgi:putative phosphoribosyl transferase